MAGGIVGEELSVNYSGFSSAYIEFTKALRDYDKILASLDREVKHSLREWSGDAQRAYHVKHSEWIAASRYMHSWLDLLCRNIHDSHQALRAADDAVANKW
jgi:WXG100 family type VII secretion target